MNKPTSVILPNLRPMVTWDKGQNYQVNGYLQFQMECLGESKDYDYWFFAGVCGDTLTQVFTSDTSKCAHSLSHIDFSPEVAKTWYDAVGYDFTIVTEEQFNADRPRYVGELVKCIDRGIPVVAKETASSTRPNYREFSLLVGYEDGGGQLLFLEGDHTTPYKVPTNRNVSYLFLIPGAKKKAPPLADVYRKAVLNIPTLLTRPKKGDVSFGRGAFAAWADHLLAEDYVGKTDEELGLWELHTTYVCILLTNGHCRTFLDRAAKLCPDLEFLPDVNKQYAEMERLGGELQAAGGSFNITPATLRNKEAKRPIAEVLRRMGACCDRIVDIYRKNGYGPGTGALESERLMLRKLEPEDFNDFWELSKNWKKAPGPDFDKFPTDETECRKFFNYSLKNGANTRFIYLRSKKKIIGLICMNGMDKDGQMDMGHIIHSDYQDNNIDKEALSLFVAYIFNTTDAKAIITNNDPDKKQNAPLYTIGFTDRNKNGGQLILQKVKWTELTKREAETRGILEKKPVQTPRLVVRLFNTDDWKELQQLAIDKKNTGGDRYDHAFPTDDKGAQAMAQWCVGQQCFAVCLKDSGKLIGFIRFNSIDDKGQLDLGHMFHSRYRGEGYAAEAMRPLLAVAFTDPKVNAIVARNAVEWPGQLTPLVELGFRELSRDHVPNFNGAAGGPNGFTACRMGLTRAEWQGGNPTPGASKDKPEVQPR